MKLGIIGVGNMGGSIIKALLSHHLVKKTNVFALDHCPQNIASLGIQNANNIPSLISHLSSGVSFLLLATKPQQFPDLANELNGKIPPSTTVISIMAGITVKKLTRELDHTKIVRAMPNTPALVGKGMTVWFATPETIRSNQYEKNPSPAKERVPEFLPLPRGRWHEVPEGVIAGRVRSEELAKIFSSFGQQLRVHSETLINAATAISGSGPAYLFTLIESWMKAAEQLGFSKKDSRMLVEQTIKGSLKLLSQSKENPTTLRKKVTSKGGTTEAALNHLNTKKWQQTFIKAIRAAHTRAKQMGR